MPLFRQNISLNGHTSLYMLSNISITKFFILQFFY
jgi:hypothetical protein